jgi:hypothetical protein
MPRHTRRRLPQRLRRAAEASDAAAAMPCRAASRAASAQLSVFAASRAACEHDERPRQEAFSLFAAFLRCRAADSRFLIQLPLFDSEAPEASFRRRRRR